MLWELNSCGVGLKTLPARFACGHGPGRTEGGKGVQNWLDDMVVHTPQVEGHLKLVGKVLGKLATAGLSFNSSKAWLCFSLHEFVGMAVDTLGVRPSQSIIDAVTQLSRATTVQGVRALLGVAGYPRRFGPRHSALVEPISDLLRNK